MILRYHKAYDALLANRKLWCYPWDRLVYLEKNVARRVNMLVKHIIYWYDSRYIWPASFHGELLKVSSNIPMARIQVHSKSF